MKRTLLALSLAIVVVMFAGTAMAQHHHGGPHPQQVVMVQGYIVSVKLPPPRA